jgi:RNA recognition motif-containing protein
VRYSTKQLAADKSDPGPFKLYISNLSRSTSEEEVRNLFSSYGQLVDDVVILKDQATNQSKGVAFVRYNTRSEAQHAIQALHEQLRDKDAAHLMQVKFAHTPSEKKLLQHQQLMGGRGPLPPHLAHLAGAGSGGPHLSFYPNQYNSNYAQPAAGYNPYNAIPSLQSAYPYGQPPQQHRSPVLKGPEVSAEQSNSGMESDI